MYVYRVTNRVNGKVYIGKWTGLRVEDRWKQHQKDSEKGSPFMFHCAIRKYGVASFRIEVLYSAKTREELSRMETFFIVLHQSHLHENGYNMTMGGDGRTWDAARELQRIKMFGNQFASGVVHSEDWKLKAQERMKGNTHHPVGIQHKARRIFVPMSDDKKRKIGAATKRAMTSERARAMAASRWGA